LAALVLVGGCGGLRTRDEGTTGKPGGGCPADSYAPPGAPATCIGKTECGRGQFVSAEGGANEDRICAGCPSGTFSTETNATLCIPWTSCAQGTFVTAPPSATTDRLCAVCPAGTTTLGPDRANCTPIGDCPAGTVRVSSGVVPACKDCSPGSYCAGAAALEIACGGDTWDDDASAATPCVTKTVCLAGEYVESAGSGTADRRCEQCLPDSFSRVLNAARCATKTACQGGQYVLNEGGVTLDRSCGACAAGTYSKGMNQASCTAWTTCQAGTRVRNTPSASEDRQCEACAPGTTTTGPNQSRCAAIGACPAGTVQTAAGTPPTCEECQPGNYCEGDTAPEVPCTAGMWDHDADPATECGPKVRCFPGQYVASEGTTTRDRVCSPCETGTFADTLNAPICREWKTCPAGVAIEAEGTSTSDRVCAGDEVDAGVPPNPDAGVPGPEAGPEAGPEPGPEAGPEPGPEAGPEPGPEAGPEPGPEAGPEPGPEAGPEPGPEAGPEPGPEAGPEPGPEAGPEPGPEAGPEAGPDTPPIPTSNLIVNGDAENGTTGWTVTGGSAVHAYGPGYVLQTEPGPANRGTYLFYGGQVASSTLVQTIDLSWYAPVIDSGSLIGYLDGYLGGYGTNDDNAVVTVSFRNATDDQVASVVIGPVMAADRTSSGLWYRGMGAVLPSGTRSAVVTVTMTRVVGTDNDGYADNLALILTNP
jgi:hypothetical protein